MRGLRSIPNFEIHNFDENLNILKCLKIPIEMPKILNKIRIIT